VIKLNFQNKKKYGKWLAFGHMHNLFETTVGNQVITINGKKHKVNHG